MYHYRADISLGFEQTQFTVREDSGLLSGVSVIKENAAITEQNLTFLLRSVDGTAMEGENDIFLTSKVYMILGTRYNDRFM